MVQPKVKGKKKRKVPFVCNCYSMRLDIRTQNQSDISVCYLCLLLDEAVDKVRRHIVFQLGFFSMI